tara:strand:+ start:5989 stop:6816 length:828 start_codon:yes stop_codon:yes gene_type:complete
LITVKHIEIIGCKEKLISIDFRYIPFDIPLVPVIYIHGYKGFKDWGANNLIADAFARKRFFFLKFNFSHNGVSSENPLDFVDLVAFGNNNYMIELKELLIVIDWLENADLPIDFSQLSIIGHSRGGGIALLGSVQDPRIKKTVTWASVSDFSTRFPLEKLQWKSLGVSHVYNGRTKQMMPLYYQFYESFIENIEILDLPSQCKKIKQAVLIVHGEDDQSVSFSEAEFLNHIIPFSILQPIQNTGHTFGAIHPYKSSDIPLGLNMAIEASVKFIRG